jgi:hypothetical protein
MAFCKGIAAGAQPVFSDSGMICGEKRLAFAQRFCILAAVFGKHRGMEWLQ